MAFPLSAPCASQSPGCASSSRSSSACSIRQPYGTSDSANGLRTSPKSSRIMKNV